MKKLVLLLSCALMSCGHRYRVKITYCDSRPPKEFCVYSVFGTPTNIDIYNYKTAVPEYKGEMNVCNIETLEQLPDRK